MKGGDDVRVVVHCKDLGADDIKYLKSIKSGHARVKVNVDGDYAMLVAEGIYDDLVNIIVQATCLKNFEVHLQ